MKLVGSCNQCGLCCYVHIDGIQFRCENLVVSGKLGEPNATKCAVHADRFNGMRIILMDQYGNVAGMSRCAKDSDEEIDSIVDKGIGKGCSMKIV